MAGIYDSNMKQLVGAYIQDFITWLLAGAVVTGELSGHLNRAIEVDILYEVTLDGQQLIFHLEFQRHRDVDMAKRVLEYNVLASCKFDCTVISFVIYLKRDGNVIESPLIRRLPSGEEVLHFNFITIKLWEISTDELRQTGLVGLLPLLPLTREGATHEVVEEVVTKLLDLEDQSRQTNLLSITFTLASLAFDAHEDKNWLIRRFKMLEDILQETEIYQYIKEQGLAEGITQGIAQGIELEQQRELQNKREMFLRFVQARFPKAVRFATKQVAVVTDGQILDDLIYKVGLAQLTEDELRKILLHLDIDDEENS